MIKIVDTNQMEEEFGDLLRLRDIPHQSPNHSFQITFQGPSGTDYCTSFRLKEDFDGNVYKVDNWEVDYIGAFYGANDGDHPVTEDEVNVDLGKRGCTLKNLLTLEIEKERKAGNLGYVDPISKTNREAKIEEIIDNAEEENILLDALNSSVERNRANSIDGWIEVRKKLKIIGETGEGYKAKVYLVKDVISGEILAMKVEGANPIGQKQMEDNGIDPIQSMIREGADRLGTSSNLVRAFGGQGPNGEQLCIMKHYRTFLSDILEDLDGRKNFYKNGIGKRLDELLMPGKEEDYVKSWIKSLADALSEVHQSNIWVAHSDVKPDNIPIDGLGAKLTDFCNTPYEGSENKRDDMGNLYIKPPEGFKKGVTPEPNYDVWSYGSVLTRIFTPNFAFEEEINAKIEEKRDFIKSGEITERQCAAWALQDLIDNGTYDSVLDQKLEAVPKEYRPIMRKSLDKDPSKRYQNGMEIVSALDELERSKEMKFRYQVVAAAIVAAVATAGAIVPWLMQKYSQPETRGKIKGNSVIVENNVETQTTRYFYDVENRRH